MTGVQTCALPIFAHVWGIAGVPSPARRADDESGFDYFISRALYVDCITSSADLGIDPPGIWRYKQTIGYYGKQSDQQVEESNAGPASKMFHCQFNTTEALGTQLQGYIEKGRSEERRVGNECRSPWSPGL